LGQAFRRRDGAIGVGDDLDDAGPFEVPVEAYTDPPPVADVGRHKEPVGRLGQERLLLAGRRGAPEGEATIAMVIVEEDRALGRDPFDFVLHTQRSFSAQTSLIPARFSSLFARFRSFFRLHGTRSHGVETPFGGPHPTPTLWERKDRRYYVTFVVRFGNNK